MFGNQLAAAAAEVRADAERHMSRITDSVTEGTEILTLTIAVIGIVAAAALLIAIVAAVDA